MIILIEGSDRTGKDTLIDHLKYFYMFPPAVEIKSSKLNLLKGDSPLYHRYATEYYRAWFSSITELARSTSNSGSTIILNRGHISEFVYAYLYRTYSANFVWTLETKFYKKVSHLHKIFLIVLTDNPQKLLQRDDGLSVSKNGARDVAKEQELFVDGFNRSKINSKIFIDIRNLTTNDVAEKVISFIDKRL